MSKVSILMPVYNADRYLKEAIDSIINQTYTDWELIIINDGSTDSSEVVIKSYSDPRLKYHINDENMGLIATLNKGIGLCKGGYIARMDADDVSMLDRLFMQIQFLEENPDCVMCGSNAIIIDNRGNDTGKIINLSSNDLLQINLLFSVPFVHPSVMIRSDILCDNLYDSNYKYAEDYDLWCRIADKYKVANLPAALLKYRWHDTNVSVVNQAIQDEVKNKIIKRQIEELGLLASKEDLWLHRITFKQYDAKLQQKPIVFSEYKELDTWFKKLIDANKIHQKYNSQLFVSYLWARWIILCIAQKKYLRILKLPLFVSLSFSILKSTFKLLLFFSKK